MGKVVTTFSVLMRLEYKIDKHEVTLRLPALIDRDGRVTNQ